MSELFTFIYLTYCFCHFLRPLYFIFLLLEVTGEDILQYVCDSRDREALVGSCGTNKQKNNTVSYTFYFTCLTLKIVNALKS